MLPRQRTSAWPPVALLPWWAKLDAWPAPADASRGRNGRRPAEGMAGSLKGHGRAVVVDGEFEKNAEKAMHKQ